jgi:hypothetical protein
LETFLWCTERTTTDRSATAFEGGLTEQEEAAASTLLKVEIIVDVRLTW